MPENIVGTEAFGGGAVLKPSDKDKGNDVFATLQEFMERLANHKHLGTDSFEISTNFAKEVSDNVVVTNFTWNLISFSRFSADLTVPGAADVDNNMRKYFFKNPAETEFREFYPEVDKVNATTIRLFANDNTITDLRVVYF